MSATRLATRPPQADTARAVVMHLARDLSAAETQAAAVFGIEVHGWCGRWRVPIRPIPDGYRVCRTCAALKARALDTRGMS